MSELYNSTLPCPNGGTHTFDEIDNHGDTYHAELGHCTKCQHWIDTTTGVDETLESEDSPFLCEDCGIQLAVDHLTETIDDETFHYCLCCGMARGLTKVH